MICSICGKELSIEDSQELLIRDSNYEYSTIPICSECKEECEE